MCRITLAANDRFACDAVCKISCKRLLARYGFSRQAIIPNLTLPVVGTTVGLFDFETSLETGGHLSVYIDRTALDTENYDGETGLGWYRLSGITYMYVSDNVTVSSGGWSQSDGWKDKNGHWVSSEENMKAFKLELKKGWNLVQWDVARESTADSVSFTDLVKIADKNVPWYIEGWGSSSRTARGNPARAFGPHSRPGLFAGR